MLATETEPREPGRVCAASRATADKTAGALVGLGQQLSFYGRAYSFLYKALLRYKREIARQVAGVTFGAGGLALVGGTAVVVGFICGAAGFEAGIDGVNQLQSVGVESLSGFLAAFFDTRAAAPVIAGVALVATVGAGFTAEIGAMRVSEEIDALETMAVPPIPFLVTTRIISGLVSITPLYAIALLASYAMTRFIAVDFFHLAAGGYDHYFATFLIPRDLISSYIEVVAMSVVIISIHCYYGYNASGGPAGVGRAVGNAVRLSLVSIMTVAFLADLVLYGNSHTLHFSR
jgi:phospholipid/cholesterol/gamma-HCH transport system permease protein